MPETHVRQADGHLGVRLKINNEFLIGECRLTIFFFNYPFTNNLLGQILYHRHIAARYRIISITTPSKHSCGANQHGTQHAKIVFLYTPIVLIIVAKIQIVFGFTSTKWIKTKKTRKARGEIS